jgi:membrane protein implicated in regulation of membrane protease activity
VYALRPHVQSQSGGGKVKSAIIAYALLMVLLAWSWYRQSRMEQVIQDQRTYIDAGCRGR